MNPYRLEGKVLKKQVADFYDAYHQERVRQPNQELLEKVWSHFEGTVLEIGAGRLLWDAPSTSEYVVAEISTEAATYSLAQGMLSIIADGESLPFGSLLFNLVACHDVLEHIVNPEQLITDMCRVARQRVLIAGPNYVGARYYRGGFNRQLPLRMLYFLLGPGRGCRRLTNAHMTFDAEWQPDFDAITAANSWWVMKRMKEHGFRATTIATWPSRFGYFNYIPVLRHIGPYMIIVGKREHA